MFTRTCKTTAVATAAMLAWSMAAVTAEALPHTYAATVTPPYSCPAVYDAIIAMQEDYPEGMSWTNDDFYAWNGGGTYYGGYGCVAFAYRMSDAAFGYLPAEEPLEYDLALLRVGDMIRYSGHTIIVLEVQSDAFIIAEGNYNSSVHWGRRVTFDSLEGQVDYYTSRYPEVFGFRENEAAIDIGATVTPAVISRDAVDLTWSTSDAAVATVNADGVITGMDNGITTVTAQYGGVSEAFTVTVGDPTLATEPAIPDGLTYSINDNNTVTITGYTGSKTQLTIPATIEGLPVTAIGALAFHRSTLTSITLPDTLTTIGISAFMESSLQSMTLPKNVSEIGNGALIAMKELTAFSVDPENPYFCSVDGVLHTADMTTLVAYPAGKTDAVYTVADGVTQIMALIFTDALYLQEINIPASVTSADMGTFVVATALQNINVDAENTVYCDIDGVLYSADKKTLVAYPYARTATAYVIPDGVETILNTSLNNASLQELTIPASVTVIEHDVYHSENLKKIYGVEGSYAQTYAEENFITFEAISETVGDINRDNAVTIADAILLSRLIAEDTTLDLAAVDWNTIDCNADGIVDLSDAVWILQSLAGV